MPACQVSGGALLRAKMMQVHFMVARGKHLPARTLSGQNYFPALATFPVQENKKVIFLLLVSARRDSGRRQSCPLAGRAGPSWRAGPAAPVYAAAKISAAEGGKLQGNAGPRKILETALPDPANDRPRTYMSEPPMGLHRPSVSPFFNFKKRLQDPISDGLPSAPCARNACR